MRSSFLLQKRRFRQKSDWLPIHRKSEGFSLIEVLVAMVVLSFGMLGIVGMQAFSLQASRDTRTQTQAVVLARELAEMMRGNWQIAVKTTITENPYLVSAMTIAKPMYCTSVANAATGCTTSTDVASAEMTDWLARAAAELPDARVTVCFDAAPFDANGLPQWACNATGANEIVYIKVGWTRASTDRSQNGSAALERANDTDSRPNLIFPVTSGSAL